ncbi:hypothetical protein KIW84_065686 [Lathyrus oleraceus]|uniref:Retrovirus-related Pol polyprotein from transposon TNT 1-94 n=1 Tax=Pisum sativum TaxID=3888 RepID=A0A9D4WGA0_PEA|nr:hypothetical protein KIW84_065686 [Pisum sativum]
MSLCFGGYKPTLLGYSDFDIAGDIDSRKSTSGYVIKFSGGVLAWQSRLQTCVLFTIEADFISIIEACKELLWLKNFLQEIGFVQDKYVLFVDSQSDIHLVVELAKVYTNDNDYDMMTKELPRGKFEACCDIAGLAISCT